MITQTRRSSTEAFKAEEVRFVRESGHLVAQVVWDLGIADHRLYRWRVEQPQADQRGQTRPSLQIRDGDASERKQKEKAKP